MAHEAIAECITVIYLFYVINKQTTYRSKVSYHSLVRRESSLARSYLLITLVSQDLTY